MAYNGNALIVHIKTILNHLAAKCVQVVKELLLGI